MAGGFSGGFTSTYSAGGSVGDSLQSGAIGGTIGGVAGFAGGAAVGRFLGGSANAVVSRASMGGLQQIGREAASGAVEGSASELVEGAAEGWREGGIWGLVSGGATGAVVGAGVGAITGGAVRAGFVAGDQLQHSVRGVMLKSVLRKAVKDVDSAIAAGDVGALRRFGGGTGEIGHIVHGTDNGRFRGNIIDSLTKERASDTFGLRSLTYTGRGSYGPDVYNARTTKAWDVTTTKEWAKGRKIAKYVTKPSTGRPTWRSLDPLLYS